MPTRIAFGPPNEVAARAGAQVLHAVAQVGRGEEDRVACSSRRVEHRARLQHELQFAARVVASAVPVR